MEESVGSDLGKLLTGFVVHNRLALRGLATLLASFTLCLTPFARGVEAGSCGRRPAPS